MNPKARWNNLKDWLKENKSIAIVGGLAITVLVAIFIKMFIDLLPFLLIGLGAFILYKMYKKGFLG